MDIRTEITGIKPLSKEVLRLSQIEWQKIVQKNLRQMMNRAAKEPGTPIGETRRLRDSRRMDTASGTMGYAVEYAPHVEYGHRTVNGGYVPGQRFLLGNVQEQQAILLKDFQAALKGR